MNPVASLSPYTCKNDCNIFLPSTLRFSKWYFAITFPNPALLYNLPPHLCTTGLTQLILHDTIIISHEVQKLRNLSLCGFLQRILLPPLLAILFKKPRSYLFWGKNLENLQQNFRRQNDIRFCVCQNNRKIELKFEEWKRVVQKLIRGITCKSRSYMRLRWTASFDNI